MSLGIEIYPPEKCKINELHNIIYFLKLLITLVVLTVSADGLKQPIINGDVYTLTIVVLSTPVTLLNEQL